MPSAYQINNQSAAYFLTFQVVGWADVFSRKVYRDILIESMEYCRNNKSLEIFAYVIMTNHVHLIWRHKENSLSAAVRDYKKHTSKKIIKEIAENRQESRKDWLELVLSYHAKHNKRVGDKQLWTHENHAVELYSPSILESRLNYIHNNPVKAGWVTKPEDYLYSSARNYAGLDSLLEIDVIS